MADLDLNDGARWELVGVKLFNFKPLAIQEELGTFILRDTAVLKTVQRTWAGRPFYRDYCDYHYAIKLYRNGELVKTLRINLDCHYISVGVLSYEFDPDLLLRHRKHFQQLPWIEVTYRDPFTLRRAIAAVEAEPNAYFYHDVAPYREDGYFVLGVDSLKFDTNRDSLLQEVEKELYRRTFVQDFIVRPQIIFIDTGTLDLSFRFEVYCDEAVYSAYRKYATSYVSQAGKFRTTAHWRSHFVTWRFEPGGNAKEEAADVKLVIVGLNRAGYERLRAGKALGSPGTSAR